MDFFKRAIEFFGYAPNILQTDNGAEFTHPTKTNRIHPLDVFCNKYHIQHKLIRPRTPWHNGKVERSHRNEIYSKAEVMLTNPHARPDLDSIMPTLLENLFNFIRDIPIVGTVISLGEALFHTRSVTGIVTDQVASYLSSYAQEQVEKAISNRFGNLVKTPIHWAFTLLSILKDPISEIFRAPNPQDTSIYDHVKAQPQYLTVFYNGKNNPTILDVAYVANENKSKEES